MLLHVKPKFQLYGHCHLVLMMSFGARVCAVVTMKWSCAIKVSPKLLKTKLQAHNYYNTPHIN